MTTKEYNILLVDDEEKFLTSVSERVRLKGVEPLTAKNAAEALELAKNNAIHAAVIDLKLPDMDGLKLIEELKKLHPEAKCALLTGFGDEKVKEAAQALQSDYFEKDQMSGFWQFIRQLTHKPISILLVDDEKKFLDSISERIRLKGFEPVTADSAAKALEIAKTHALHAAVVDLKMPDVDGLELIEALKKLHPNLHTVLLTGFGSEKVQEAAKALDADYFEKDKMGSFWEFIRKLPAKLEDSMAAMGMATGGDLDDAIDIEKDRK